MSQMTVWTTQLVEQTKEKLRYGIQTDMSCFHDRDIELKGGKILFKLDTDEVSEFVKCSQNINYFVTKYCRFLTDKGRATVTLRDYQLDILDELSEESWNDKLDDMAPKNRNYILMAARQTGKCLFDASVEISHSDLYKIEKTPINLLYYIHKEHLTFLEKLKFKLMFLYNKVDKW